MKRLPQRIALVVALVTIAFSLAAPAVSADAIYHSEHLALTPTGDQPLRSGFVENIHMNGPIVFAHENYILNGAEPNTEYQVVLLLSFNTDCTFPLPELPTAKISTNAAGNGKAEAVFKVADVPPMLHNQTLGGRWEVRAGTTVAYETECTIISID